MTTAQSRFAKSSFGLIHSSIVNDPLGVSLGLFGTTNPCD
ncbi:MAG: hypothetical protein FD138_2960 [Planctomycetota bacterium]|nr:MAG: hypothetical protein FD138_2960 [Planctomycetota bacterium]